MDRRGKRAVFEEETINRAKMIVEEFSYNDQKMIAISVLLAGVLHPHQRTNRFGLWDFSIYGHSHE